MSKFMYVNDITSVISPEKRLFSYTSKGAEHSYFNPKYDQVWTVNTFLRCAAGRRQHTQTYSRHTFLWSSATAGRRMFSTYLFFLGKIQKAELTLNPSKLSEWEWKELRYLSYRLGRGELHLQMDKLEAIQNCPQPRTEKDIQFFPGLTGWYKPSLLVKAQFVANAAPLTALIYSFWSPKEPSNLVRWLWNSPHHLENQPLCSKTSRKDFWYRFTHGHPWDEHPILYLNLKLQPCETSYSTVEKRAWWWKITFPSCHRLPTSRRRVWCDGATLSLTVGSTHTCTHTAYLSVVSLVTGRALTHTRTLHTSQLCCWLQSAHTHTHTHTLHTHSVVSLAAGSAHTVHFSNPFT